MDEGNCIGIFWNDGYFFSIFYHCMHASCRCCFKENMQDTWKASDLRIQRRPHFHRRSQKMALLDFDKQTQPVRVFWETLMVFFLAIFEDFPTLPRYEFSSTTLSTILLMIRLQQMCRSLYIHITCTHTWKIEWHYTVKTQSMKMLKYKDLSHMISNSCNVYT